MRDSPFYQCFDALIETLSDEQKQLFEQAHANLAFDLRNMFGAQKGLNMLIKLSIEKNKNLEKIPKWIEKSDKSLTQLSDLLDIDLGRNRKE